MGYNDSIIVGKIIMKFNGEFTIETESAVAYSHIMKLLDNRFMDHERIGEQRIIQNMVSAITKFASGK